MFYVRYRRSTLEVRISPRPTQDVLDAVRSGAVIREEGDDPYDGLMTEAEMRTRTREVLDFRGME
jgi:hypothetical protein